MRRSVARPALLLIPIALAGTRLHAQSTATVPPNDPVYSFLDVLAGTGKLNTIVGQRPLSRAEIARLLASADSTGGGEWVTHTLSLYRAVYPTAPRRTASIDRIEARLTRAQSPSRNIETDANGSIDVDVNPLLANRLGVRSVDGTSGTLGASATAPLGNNLVTVLAGRADLLASRRGSSLLGQLDQAYARTLWKDVSITVGRDYDFFGQDPTVGLINGSDARAQDAIRIATEHPLYVPGVSRVLGALRGTMYLSDLGSHQRFPHTRLLAYKLSGKPFSRFELGATVGDEVGGQGAPGGTLLQKIEDAFPLLDATILHRRTFFSNKIVGMDARLQLSHAAGAQLFMEGAFDDFDFRRKKSTFTEDAGYVWGASLSCMPTCGAETLTATYQVTGLRYYTHGDFTSGYTLENRFLGNPLGPRGKAFTASYAVGRVHYRIVVDAAHEIRSGNKYGSASTTTDDSDFHFVLYEHHPTERRWRTVVHATGGAPGSRMTTLLGAGVERVEHFGFQPGAWRTNLIAEAGITLHPDWSRH